MAEDERSVPRGGTAEISAANVAEAIAKRKAAEAAAEQADERARIATLGGVAFGILGLIVTGVGLLVFRDLLIGTFGAGIGLVGFGVVTAAQWAKIRGGA